MLCRSHSSVSAQVAGAAEPSKTDWVPVWVILQSGLGLSTPPKGTVITIGSAMDSQQVNPLYYKQTDETSKFEQVTIHELLLQLSDSKAVIYAAAIAACMQYCIRRSWQNRASNVGSVLGYTEHSDHAMAIGCRNGNMPKFVRMLN